MEARRPPASKLIWLSIRPCDGPRRMSITIPFPPQQPNDHDVCKESKKGKRNRRREEERVSGAAEKRNTPSPGRRGRAIQAKCPRRGPCRSLISSHLNESPVPKRATTPSFSFHVDTAERQADSNLPRWPAAFPFSPSSTPSPAMQCCVGLQTLTLLLVTAGAVVASDGLFVLLAAPPDHPSRAQGRKPVTKGSLYRDLRQTNQLQSKRQRIHAACEQALFIGVIRHADLWGPAPG
ncbi:hypothetical protein CDD83_9694 [Cordyceps sp. RAO-2017]|nr:hypothetical protein CDD83_9694 [Cordyceps sp. RAO-2017]